MPGYPPGQQMQPGYPPGQQMQPGYMPGQQMQPGYMQGPGTNFGTQVHVSPTINPTISTPENIHLTNVVETRGRGGTSQVGSDDLYEMLKDYDQLMVCQSVSMMKIVFGLQPNNYYEIEECTSREDQIGQGRKILFARETSTCCNLVFSGINRSFSMIVCDGNGSTLLEFYRGRTCWEECCRTRCCESCRDQVLMRVESKGRPIGSITTECCPPPCVPVQLLVKNRNAAPIYRLGRTCDCGFQCCTCNCVPCGCACMCPEIILPILDGSGTRELGMIVKKRGGFIREIFTDSDDFYIKFPEGCDEEMKGVFLGGVILWDFQRFERPAHLKFIFVMYIIFVSFYLFFKANQETSDQVLY